RADGGRFSDRTAHPAGLHSAGALFHPRPAGWQRERLTAVAIRLDHCVIHVTDWERSNAFYRDVLDAELIARGSGWAYRFGSVQINCHGPGVVAEPLEREPVMPGNSDLCFVWDGTIEQAIIHLEARGVEVE